MSQHGKMVVLGSINVDHVLNLQRFPNPGETIAGNDYKIAFGGKGANQAVAVGRSGTAVSFIGCVGEDDIGQRIRQQLGKDNVAVAAVQTMPGVNTGVALIQVNAQGENTIALSAGANNLVTPDYLHQYETLIIQADLLLMQLEVPLETVIAAAKLAKAQQTKVILNPAPARELPDELLACVDIITPNETEAERLTGIAIKDENDAKRAAEFLHRKGVRLVIITLGSKGAWVSENDQAELIPGFKVKAVDTVAAGDTFNGALATALLEKVPLRKAIVFAHAAAALSVTRHGAQPSVPWRKEIDDFLKQQGL